MRATCFGLMLAVVAMAGPVRGQPAATEAEQSADLTAVLDTWRTTRQRAAQVATLYRNSNADGRSKMLPEFLESMETASDVMAETVPILEAAYAQNPNDTAVNEAILTIARISLEMDQTEISYRMGRLLANDTPEPGLVHVVAGQAAFEMGEMDDAQRYLALGQRFAGLSANQKQAISRLLAAAGRRKPIVERERERLAADAQAAEPLPRIKLTTNRGDIVIELFEDDAPNSVASIISLVEKGFYNEKTFFRVEQGFGAVTGSPTNDGKGGPGYETIREESPRGARPHLRGYVSMVPFKPTTNGSQLFIVCRPGNCEQLDSRQDVVGRVVEGMNVVERLRPFDATRTRVDVEPDRILRAEVLSKRGHEYRPASTVEMAEEEVRRALQCYTREDFKGAVESFRRALKYKPGNSGLHFNLAAALISLGDVKDAEKELREAVRIDPRYIKGWQLLISLVAQRGNMEEVIGDLNTALRANPGDKTLLALLAEANQVKAQMQAEKAGEPVLSAPPE